MKTDKEKIKFLISLISVLSTEQLAQLIADDSRSYFIRKAAFDEIKTRDFEE